MSKFKNTMQKLKVNARSSGIFANIETIGSYDDFSQTVCIDYLDEQNYIKLAEACELYLKEGISDYEPMTKFYSTCVHEFTHWLDHTSTLWGQKQLVVIYNSINAWTNRKEQDFHHIAIANSERFRARLSSYYTEKYPIDIQETATNIWRYAYSCGLEFGVDGRSRVDRPIIFTIFSNCNNQKIIRVPFSIVALTECNATYAELKVKLQGLALLDEDSRIVELALLERKIKQNLYNPELAIYSVATHCLANSIKPNNDVLQSYKFSAALATLCLNLPEILFSSLNIPEEFNIWGDRVQALQKLADPGFAFLIISNQAPKYQTEVSVEQWLTEAIQNAGLPSLEVINKLILEQMKKLEKEIIDGDHTNRLRYLLTVGRKNFTERGIWGKNVLSMENFGKNSIILPPVCLGDGYITSAIVNTMPTNRKDLEQWIEQVIEIESSVNNFIRACRL